MSATLKIPLSAMPKSVHENLMAGLRKDLTAPQVEAILDKYGSIGASPYRVDVASLALETRYGHAPAPAHAIPEAPG